MSIDRLFRILAGLVALQVASLFAAEQEGVPSAADKGRVLIVEQPGATRAFVPQPSVVRDLFRAGLTRFTGKPNETEAWLSLVSTQDVVGLKVFSSPGAASGTRKAVVAAAIEGLLDARIQAERIIVWDKRLIDLRLADYDEIARKYKVRLAGAIDSGFDGEAAYSNELLGRLVYGDHEFGKRGEGVGRKSFVTTLLTQRITKVVNITPLLNHNLAGVSGALYGMAMGSVDNTLRFEESDRLPNSIPEIYAMAEVGDKVVLNIVDALICQYRGEERTLLHYSTPLDQLWFAKDPVALDVLALAELERQSKDRKLPKSTQLIYENAALLELGVAEPKRIRIEKAVFN